jgi:hypothetical protein
MPASGGDLPFPQGKIEGPLSTKPEVQRMARPVCKVVCRNRG